MKNRKRFIAVLCSCIVFFAFGCDKKTTTSIVLENNADETLFGENEKNEIDIPLRKDGVITLKLGYSTNNEDPRAIVSEQFKKSVEEKTKGTV